MILDITDSLLQLAAGRLDYAKAQALPDRVLTLFEEPEAHSDDEPVPLERDGKPIIVYAIKLKEERNPKVTVLNRMLDIGRARLAARMKRRNYKLSIFLSVMS